MNNAPTNQPAKPQMPDKSTVGNNCAVSLSGKNRSETAIEKIHTTAMGAERMKQRIKTKMAMRNPEQTIGNLIDAQGVSFIGSIDQAGFPNMKAMLPPRKREGIKDFWFTSNTSSRRAAQYKANPNACIYFYDKRFFRGVMLKGKMQVLTDAETKREIWRQGEPIESFLQTG